MKTTIKTVITLLLINLSLVTFSQSKPSEEETRNYINKNFEIYSNNNMKFKIFYFTPNGKFYLKYDNGEDRYRKVGTSGVYNNTIHKIEFNLISVNIRFNEDTGKLSFICKSNQCINEQEKFDGSRTVYNETTILSLKFNNPSSIVMAKRLYKAFKHFNELKEDDDPFKD